MTRKVCIYWMRQNDVVLACSTHNGQMVHNPRMLSDLCPMQSTDKCSGCQKDVAKPAEYCKGEPAR